MRLNDSPAGLAAWIVEKFQRWSDCDGDVETRFTKDELLTNVMTLLGHRRRIGSSFLPYYDLTHAGALRWMIEKAKEWVGSSKVPAGFALFPKDISHPPREWAERFFNVQRWTEMPRGGHFAAHGGAGAAGRGHARVLPPAAGDVEPVGATGRTRSESHT